MCTKYILSLLFRHVAKAIFTSALHSTFSLKLFSLKLKHNSETIIFQTVDFIREVRDEPMNNLEILTEPATLAAVAKDLNEVKLPRLVQLGEKQLRENGGKFLVGSKVSWWFFFHLNSVCDAIAVEEYFASMEHKTFIVASTEVKYFFKKPSVLVQLLQQQQQFT